MLSYVCLLFLALQCVNFAENYHLLRLKFAFHQKVRLIGGSKTLRKNGAHK